MEINLNIRITSTIKMTRLPQMQNATVVVIFLKWNYILFPKCVKGQNISVLRWRGIESAVYLFTWAAGYLLATCHLVIYYMSTGHLFGGTYVSASVGLVSKLDAGDMEQRLSEGLAHLPKPFADCRLCPYFCPLGFRARINTTWSLSQVYS